MATLAARIDARLAAPPARTPALVVDGKITDHATHIDRIRRTMALFAARGLTPGHRVAILSTDVAAVATLMLAGLRHGLAMVNLNPDLSPADAQTALTACAPACLFIDAPLLTTLPLPATLPTIPIGAATAPKSLFARLRTATPASGYWADIAALAPVPPPPHPAPDAPALMLFTSGTTSAPKVVVLSHANLTAQLAAFDTVYDYDAASRILNPLPLHFTDGLMHGPLIAFLSGAALHRPTRFDFIAIEDLVHSIHRDRITHFIVVPALLALLDRLGDAFADAFHGADFRYIRSSGDALPETLWRAIESRFNVTVANTYGMSETVCEATYAGPDPATRIHGSIGRAIGCEARVVDDAGQPLPPGTPGTLQISGAIVMQGYLNQPALTAAAIQHGWLDTGDLATIDAAGIIRITGRRKALIISGGTNIQPQDISDCLLTHPAVAEAHAFGQPHALWGEQVAAAVRLRPGATTTPEALTAHCAAALSPHKVPRLIAILSDLPRNPAGKVLIDALRTAVARLDTSAGSASEDDVWSAVRQLAAREFGLPPAALRLTAEALSTPGWNSLAHINLVTAVEAHFTVSLTATDILRLHSLADFVAAVQSRRPRA